MLRLALAWLRWLVRGTPMQTMNPRALQWARERKSPIGDKSQMSPRGYNK